MPQAFMISEENAIYQANLPIPDDNKKPAGSNGASGFELF
jgi:hypothetical protein